MSSRVTVVMPAHDAAETVGAAAASVLWQTFRDRELVVVDDGSTDATGAIVEAHEGPVRLVQQEQAGVAAARNRGITEANGELIAFCDADDLWFPRQLEALVELYDRHGGIVTTNSWWLFPGGIHRSRTRYKGGFPRPERQRLAILEQNFVSTMSLFPRALFEQLDGFDAELRRAEDWDFWMRAIFAGQRVTLQAEPLSLYRWSDDSLSANREEMDEAVQAVLRKADEQLPLTTEERGYVRRRLEGPGLQETGRRAEEALRAGRYGEAARGFRAAAALAPSERRLLWKARLIGLAPRLVGPAIRARQLAIERRVGFGPEHER